MCNNNVIFIVEKKERAKKDFADWFTNKPVLPENNEARKFKVVTNKRISYDDNHPLVLHDGTKVYGIWVFEKNKESKKIAIDYLLNGEEETRVKIITRKIEDELEEVEKFLEDSISIVQLRNVDLVTA